MVTKVTQTVADFATAVTFDQLPELVIQSTKRILLDSIGCALGGFNIDRSRIALEMANELGGKPQATIIGDSKTSYTMAAFVNGELINALDYDPCGPLTPHVSCYVISPCLAIAERAKASGKDLITALALAHEVGGRAASSVAQHSILKDEPPYYEWAPRFSFTSTVFGAVAGAGWLLHLNSQQMANAFGIAGASTPVPAGTKWEETPGPAIMTKYNCWSGWISQLGTVAALAAERGFTGDTTILDGDWGYWKIYGSPFFKVDNLLGKLGEKWHLNLVHYKPYPTCKLNHSSIEGVNEIMLRDEIKPEDIERIIVRGDPLLLTPNRAQTEITSFADAQFCSAFIVALAVFHGRRPSPAWQFPGTFNDPKLLDLMKKVKVEVHPNAEETTIKAAKAGSMTGFFGATVEVTARGKKYVAEIAETKGGPANPLSDDELIAKFKTNADYSLVRTDKIERIVDTIFNLEKVDNINKLFSLLIVE